MTDKPILAKRSHRDGHIEVQMELSVRSFGGGCIRMKADTDISTESARQLAADIIRLSDEADAKIAKKKAAEERRQKWRDREIAAGRMRVVSLRGGLHG